MKRVAIVTKSAFTQEARMRAQEIMEQEGFSVKVLEGSYTDETLKETLKDVHALIVRSDKVTDEVLSYAKDLQLVIRAGAGYNNIDVDSSTEKGIIVMNTPGQNANSVAELALGMMLSIKRQLAKADMSTKAGDFLKSALTGGELYQKKLGIHGLGYIGQLLAHKARGCGMQVFSYDPWVNPETAKNCGVTLVSNVEDLYRNADVISLHIPATEKTKSSINSKLLSLMKEDGILINTARSELINDADLEKILTERPDFSYAADVAPEGDVAGEKRYAKFKDQVFLTPHIGASTKEANFRTITAAARQVVGFFLEGAMEAAVNRQVVPFWLSDYARLSETLGRTAASIVSGYPDELRVICYGELEKYTKNFAGHILKGLYAHQDMTPLSALEKAEQSGMHLVTNIVPDNSRGHGDSITLDYRARTDHGLEEISIRGTISEGIKKISRIADYRNVDFSFSGNTVIFEYNEKEGMADRLGDYFTRKGYNKKQGRFTQNADGRRAISLFELKKKDTSDQTAFDEIAKIAQEAKEKEPDVLRVSIVQEHS
jgi:D-3-phosphoglycerate dehydrogenase